MSDHARKGKGRRRRRRFQRDRKKGPRPSGPPSSLEPMFTAPVQSEEEASTCPLCSRRIRDPLAAVGYGENREPAHFDCIVNSLRANRELRGDERICYLGSGSFGIVRSAGGGKGFAIREKFPLEAEPNRPEWRQKLRAVKPS